MLNHFYQLQPRTRCCQNSREHCHGSGNEVPHERGRREKTQAGIPRETIAVERIWNKRPDAFAIKMPTTEKAGEFKRKSCVTDQYVTRAKNVAVAQYASIKSALERTLNPQGWTVNQRSKKLHIRAKISDREGLTRQPSLFQGPAYNGHNGTHIQMDTDPNGPLPPLITSLQVWQPNNIRRQKEERKGTVQYQHTLLHILIRRRPTGRP
jgi:hypothetical protein